MWRSCLDEEGVKESEISDWRHSGTIFNGENLWITLRWWWSRSQIGVKTYFTRWHHVSNALVKTEVEKYQGWSGLWVAPERIPFLAFWNSAVLEDYSNKPWSAERDAWSPLLPDELLRKPDSETSGIIRTCLLRILPDDFDLSSLFRMRPFVPQRVDHRSPLRSLSMRNHNFITVKRLIARTVHRFGIL